MLPPVLEIYVVWHPGDARGRQIAEEFVEHFHGTAFSGLIGGAIEVYARSSGWRASDDAPRPIPFAGNVLPGDVRAAEYVAVVPVLGNELAASVQREGSAWRDYVQAIARARADYPQSIGVFPYLLDRGALDRTALGDALSRFQRIAANPPGEGESEKSLRCRDLAQGIAQLLSEAGQQRVTVFISHTKRQSPGEGEQVEALVNTVREVIRTTHLGEFFDAADLQPGGDWDRELRANAATSALLAIRTDLYATREWCQREVLIAKREGMPVIVMDALADVEERGSFLMDHSPRVATRIADGQWKKADVHRGLNLLVDECLKRALWRRQEQLAREELELSVSWWAPHAPEPITLSNWMESERRAGRLAGVGESLVILHPDPPLGTDEKSVLQEMLSLAGINRTLDVMTPRMLAARGS